MSAHAAVPALRKMAGDDGLLELHGLLESAQTDWKEDVFNTASDRFERRLSEGVAGLRGEMTQMHSSLLRWMFVFWIGQLLTMLSVVAMILRAVNLL
jgi:hypothetical protein